MSLHPQIYPNMPEAVAMASKKLGRGYVMGGTEKKSSVVKNIVESLSQHAAT